MNAENQQKLFQAMADPAFYPHETSQIKSLETHISKVFLTGYYVYKIKKPMDLGFLDFSTIEKRRFYCDREIILNRRLTKDIYLDVVAITVKHKSYALGGKRDIVEYAVKMRQLDDSRSLLQMIKSQEINRDDVTDLGRKLAQFYINAPISDHLQTGDGWQNVLDACRENFKQTQPFSKTLLHRKTWKTVQEATLSFLQTRKSYFIHRFKTGKVRDCHGDLRTGHIYFTDTGIQIIDCIEFNDRLRHIDVINDLAFLLMDLDFRGKHGIGDCLLNEFLKATDDLKAFLLLDFYKCYRAFVRCKVNCIFLASQKTPPQEREKKLLDMRRYLDLSHEYALQFSRPSIWIICGMPATGKSTIANALARTLEIEPIRSDVIRKTLFGLAPHECGGTRFKEKIYSSAGTALTYETLLHRAQQEIANGSSVILDATFSKASQRANLISLAKVKGIKPVFIECQATEKIMKERLLRRQFTPSISDARLENFNALKSRYQHLSCDNNIRHIIVNTALPLDKCIRHLLIKAFGKKEGGKYV
jgi:aminoglycoside phosphotransferase family enzyme/predicted kinase